MTAAPFKYWAFISYSHHDARWGARVHAWLETYRIPPALVGKPARDGVVPARVFPVFRDREELPVSSDLGANITEALRASRYLVVICSPDAATSRWVNEEILTFKRLGRANRILALMVRGQPNAADQPGIAPSAECFPPALQFRLGDDGQLTAERTEPIAADARAGGDGEAAARLKLLAGLLGVNFDDLRQRDNERRIRRQRLITAAVAGILAVFVALSVYAAYEARVARRQEAIANERLSRSLAARARLAAEAGDDASAAILYAEAYTTHPADDTAANASAFRNVWRLRERFPPADCLKRLEGVADARGFPAGVCPQQVAISPDAGTLVAAALHGPVRVIDLVTPRIVGTLAIDQARALTSVLFAPDGRAVAIAGLDGTIQIFATDRLQPIGQPIHITAGFPSLAFSADGRRLLTWSQDGARQTWDAATGAAVATPPSAAPLPVDRTSYLPRVSTDGRSILLFRGPRAVPWSLVDDRPSGPPIPSGLARAGAWSPDGSRVATTNDDTTEVWDVASGRPLFSLSHGLASEVEFSPDGKLVATIAADTAYLWNAETGAKTGIIAADGLESAAFSPDSRFLATASSDRSIRIWSTDGGRPTGRSLQFEQGVVAVRWPSPATIAAIQIGGEISLWDVSAPLPQAFALPNRDRVEVVSVSPDGTRIVSGNGQLRLWDGATGTAIGEPLPGNVMFTGYLTFSPDSQQLVTGGDTVRAWQAKTGGRIDLTLPDLGRLGNSPKVLFSPDGRSLAAWSTMLQVWDVASGQIVVPAIPSATRWDDVVFSADGREVIATDREHPVRRWRMPGGQPLGPEPAGTAAGDNGLISPRGTRVFRAGVEVLARSVVFDSATGRALVPELAHHGALSSVAFSPDDRTIAVADQSQLRLWDTTTGRLVGAPIDRRGIRRMAFDSAGVWLATASEDGRIRLWSVRSGEEVGRLMTHAGPARTLAFFPDGRRLVSGGDDRLARVFDVGYLGARPDPAQLVREVQVATALRLTPQGQIERLPLEEWQRLRAALGSK